MRAEGKKGGKLRKKEIPKTGGKEAAKQATQKPVESTRFTRGASRTPLQEKVTPKRKASPSSAPKKATPAKKTRSASPSPAPAARHRAPKGEALAMKKWGYQITNGPKTWNRDFPIADGKNQSPVNIETSHALYDPSLTSNILTTKYDLERHLDLSNTGHSISAKINQESLHLVHYNCDKYKSFSEAANKHDGLSVLGVMIEAGDEHLGFRTLVENIEDLKKPEAKYTIRSSFAPSCLLPGNTCNFWTYQGSLTTPPLYESVQWIVFQDPISLSSEQLERLRFLTDSDGHQMVNNFRPPCDMKGRKLRKSFA